MPAAAKSAQPQSDLFRLAQSVGIQTSYLDMRGREHRASPEVLRALLELWQLPAANAREVRDSLRRFQAERSRRPLDAVGVVWQGSAGAVNTNLPDGLASSAIHARLLGENGVEIPLPKPPHAWRVLNRFQIDGAAFRTSRIRLPQLPVGYHQLTVEFDGRTHHQLLISAPIESWSPPNAGKSLGLFLPVYAAHSGTSWGAGSLKDWQTLAHWASRQGVKTLGTLPLLATFLDGPSADPSPYSPVSRLFWNEFYIYVPAAPEFSTCERARQWTQSPSFQRSLRAFRDNDYIDYLAQMKVRRKALEALSNRFFRSEPPSRTRFEEFRRARTGLDDYAAFRATCEQLGTSWHSWEHRLKHGRIEPSDFSRRVRDYHLYVQWLAQQQIDSLRARARESGINFYLDLPLGVHPDGYDAWRFRDLFAPGVRTGAPPDHFFTGGQDWGFAPLHPQTIRNQGYGYVRDYLRFQMRHSDWLRIDHVMGLHRLFWIPPNFSAKDGVYVSYNAEELYAILCLESHRQKTVLVGENLGTVPPEVNEGMDRHRLRKMYVVQFEARDQPRQALPSPPANSVASLNTHDTPTFAAFYQAADVDLKAELGLIPADAADGEKRGREQLNRALTDFLKRKKFLDESQTDLPAIIEACLKWLAASPAELALINLEDLWAELRPQNVPGTSSERPNWRRKAAKSLEQILSDKNMAKILKRLRDLRGKPAS